MVNCRLEVGGWGLQVNAWLQPSTFNLLFFQFILFDPGYFPVFIEAPCLTDITHHFLSPGFGGLYSPDTHHGFFLITGLKGYQGIDRRDAGAE